MQLLSYFRIIPWTITHTIRTQYLNIKCDVLVVLNSPCKYNMMKKNVNNKKGDDFVEIFALYIVTNDFLEIFSFDTNLIRLIILGLLNSYGKHIGKNQQRFK